MSSYYSHFYQSDWLNEDERKGIKEVSEMSQISDLRNLVYCGTVY